MPQIQFNGSEIICEAGANLRLILMNHEIPLYNGIARTIHCRGLGTCGTCAVRVLGNVSPPTRVERMRLAIPPHRPDQHLRLACQCKVQGDIEVTKLAGLWGNREVS